jgi:hypothetical protein
MQDLDTAHMSATSSAETGEPVEILNSLLQSELAVADAYRTAFASGARFVLDDITELHRFELDHRRTAAELREEILRLRGLPAETAGAWGAFTGVYQTAASLFGARTALEALHESEEHELEEVEEAISRVPGETRRLLEERLAPREREHIEALGAILLENRFG